MSDADADAIPVPPPVYTLTPQILARSLQDVALVRASPSDLRAVCVRCALPPPDELDPEDPEANAGLTPPLTDASALAAFQHLQHVALPSHPLDTAALSAALTPIRGLKTLSIAGNPAATDLSFLGHPALTALDVSGAALSSLQGLGGAPALEHLTANGLEALTTVAADPLPASLTAAELRGAALTSLASLRAPGLQRLYLAGAALERLDLVPDALPELTVLHLRDCAALSSVQGLAAAAPKLRYLNLRGCTALESADGLEGLELAACLLDGAGVPREAVIRAVPGIGRLDKAPLDPEEREEALRPVEEPEASDE
jgi:hypothetical protein